MVQKYRIYYKKTGKVSRVLNKKELNESMEHYKKSFGKNYKQTVQAIEHKPVKRKSNSATSFGFNKLLWR